MKNVLISAPYMLRQSERPIIDKLLKQLEISYDYADVKERLEESDLLKIIPKYHGIICGDDRFTQKVYDHATKLEVVVKWGTGIDSINKEIAVKKGIEVFRTPGAFTEPVSETTLGFMLNLSRNINLNDSIIKKGGWDKPQGFCLSEKIVGLIGFGEIGQAVARKLKPFNVQVLVNDIISIDRDLAASLNVKIASKEEIYNQCDFISLHCDLNNTNHHLLNREVFMQMRRKPCIINTARGPLINEKDLCLALEQSVISGACLDVFEIEPLPLSSPLRHNSNVVLSSHNSNSSPGCWMNVHINSVNMLKQGLKLK